MAANNFGFNIGKGGISDLFKQVEVKPVRGVQFAPTPRLPREREKDAKKGIQGALLGAISPLLAEASIRGLGKLPGLERLLYQKSPDVLKELGVEDPTLGTKRQPTLGTRERRRSIEDLAGRQLTDDEYELLEDSSKLRKLGIGEKVLDPFEEEAKKPSSKTKVDQAAAQLAINDYIAGKRTKEQTQALIAQLNLKAKLGTADLYENITKIAGTGSVPSASVLESALKVTEDTRGKPIVRVKKALKDDGTPNYQIEEKDYDSFIVTEIPKQIIYIDANGVETQIY